jgi:hypothetical protein
MAPGRVEQAEKISSAAYDPFDADCICTYPKENYILPHCRQPRIDAKFGTYLVQLRLFCDLSHPSP